MQYFIRVRVSFISSRPRLLSRLRPWSRPGADRPESSSVATRVGARFTLQVACQPPRWPPVRSSWRPSQLRPTRSQRMMDDGGAAPGGGALGFGVPTLDGACCETPGLSSSSPGCGGPGGRVREYSLTGGLGFSSNRSGISIVALQDCAMSMSGFPKGPGYPKGNSHQDMVWPGSTDSVISKEYGHQPLALQNLTLRLRPAGIRRPVVFFKTNRIQPSLKMGGESLQSTAYSLAIASMVVAAKRPATTAASRASRSFRRRRASPWANIATDLRKSR